MIYQVRATRQSGEGIYFDYKNIIAAFAKQNELIAKGWDATIVEIPL